MWICTVKVYSRELDIYDQIYAVGTGIEYDTSRTHCVIHVNRPLLILFVGPSYFVLLDLQTWSIGRPADLVPWRVCRPHPLEGLQTWSIGMQTMSIGTGFEDLPSNRKTV